MKSTYLLFTFSLFLTLEASGNPCSLDGATKNCSGFKESDPPIRTLSDGTVIPNYAAILKKKSTTQQTKSSNQSAEYISTLTTKAGEAVSDVLNGYGDKISTTVQVSMLQYPLVDWKGIVEGKELSFTAFVPWPLDQKGAPSKAVKRSEIQTELKRLLGDYGFAALKSAYEKWPTIAKVSEDNQDPVQKKLMTVTPERKKHVSNLIAKTKDLLVQEILQGRDASKLSEPEKRAVSKINSIKVGDFDELKNEGACAGPVSQAFFNPMDHSINICPNFYNFPDSTIVSVVGHEMAHAIDACNSQFGVFSVDQSKVSKLSTKDPNAPSTDSKINENAEKLKLFGYLQYAAGRNLSPSSLPLDLLFPEEAIQYLKDAGCITETVSGTSLDSYFLKDSYECLIKNKKFQSNADMSAMIDKIIQIRTRERRDGYTTDLDREKNRKKLKDAFSKHPECMPGEDKSEMGEVMADYLGSRVLGEFLKNQPAPKDDAEKIAPLSFFASLACMDMNKKKTESKEETPYDILDEAYKDARKIYDPHPIAIERLEKVFMSDAHVREKLGCGKLTPTESCEHDYRKVKTTPTQQTKTTAPAVQSRGEP